MDFVNELGALALATRLKRLSERLAQDVSRIYKEHQLDFESKWFLVIALLDRSGPMPVGELSEALKLSHPAIVQFADQMLQRGLIQSVQDQHDGRKRMLSLSAEGKQLLIRLAPILAIIKTQNEAWIAEATGDLLTVIGKLEKSLDEQSMYERVKGIMEEKL